MAAPEQEVRVPAQLRVDLGEDVARPHGEELRAVRARAVLEVAERRMAENPDFLLERGHRREPRPQVA